MRPVTGGDGTQARVDQWLCAVRIYKTRNRRLTDRLRSQNE
jgi:ribosomal 50S subunit-recycling heat shock protein